MHRLARSRHAFPLAVLVLVVLLDLMAGRGHGVTGLLVMTPLVAATALGRRATGWYGVAALAVAALLGLYDGQYAPDARGAAVIRFFGLAFGTGLALLACTMRLRREADYAAARAEAVAARSSVELAERLQRSLLTDPPTVPGVQLSVRYLPAVVHAEVGGDWYDAFRLPCGGTMLVIGDVAGHDVAAATTMAQVRGILRGIAQTVTESPAAVLDSLDRALAVFGVDTLVTLVVATLRPLEDGTSVLNWSNAGHPAPVLSAGGTARLLEHPADRLLGTGEPCTRADHQVALRPEDTLVFYTDGLVERRGAGLDEGTAWLLDRVTALAGQPLEFLSDGLLAGLDARLDDIAVLAVRIC